VEVNLGEASKFANYTYTEGELLFTFVTNDPLIIENEAVITIIAYETIN
jgi:hypothetical protein